MSMPMFSVPLRPPTIEELAWNKKAIADAPEHWLTPVDEAVRAVREAQDSVGKDIWEK